MTKPKYILNDIDTAVSEMIQGLLRQYPQTLQACHAPYSNVLISTKAPNTIALISGGGSGHEPSHAGWIGTGMLTAVVCGGIFASPSVAAIRAAIRAVPASSVLLIVKNYTGDRLNFGMAAELETEKRVEMVVVADDVALPRSKGTARGLAGTVLVHKIAGAATAAGWSFENMVAVARVACARMGTLGVALETVTVPGATACQRLPDDQLEVGLGIHGEAGWKQCPLMTADEMASTMITSIQSYGRLDDDNNIVPMFEQGDELCVLVNNLGGTSEFEMSILTNAVIAQLESIHQVKVRLLYVGSYMTSFNMHGASLTILNLTNELTELLEAPTDAPAWKPSQAAIQPLPPRSVPLANPEMEDSVLPKLQIDNFSVIARNMLTAAAQCLIDNEPLLTQYDTVVGDGDCGLTMKRGAVALLQDKELDASHPARLYTQIANIISNSMGGTSGVLLELGFRKMAACLRRCETNITAEELFKAFQQGVQAIGLYGGATVGARTMMDALIPASQVELSLRDMAVAARQGANETAAMKTASAGRSHYLSEESLQGTPDPGAIAMALILEAMVDSLS